MKTERLESNIGRKLRDLRKQKGISMRKAAKLIGVPETTYREWEYGRSIKGEPYIRIANAFGTTIQDLLGETPQYHNSPEHQIDKIILDLTLLKRSFLDR